MNAGDTAWMLISASMVLFMTPAVAIFYGGMTSSKGVINMFMMSFGALGLVAVLWITFGYSMAFGPDLAAGLVGNPLEAAGLNRLLGAGENTPLTGTIPELVFVGFQGAFAVLTVALISGSIADRARFGSWMLFAGLWATLVYFPVAHWVLSFTEDDAGNSTGGWIGQTLGAIDFAGGTAVHINAGAAGLALALILGRRLGFTTHPTPPTP